MTRFSAHADPSIGISKENEISNEYKASYNKKLTIGNFKRYNIRISLKLGFLAFYNDNNTMVKFNSSVL